MNFGRRASEAGTKNCGGGTPEAIPLSRDATGQEARARWKFLPHRVAKRLLRGIFSTPLFLPAPPDSFSNCDKIKREFSLSFFIYQKFVLI